MPSRLLAALFLAAATATEDCLTSFAGKVGLHTDVGPYAPLKACNKVKAGEAALNGDDPETVCNSAYKIAGNTFKICKCARPRPSRRSAPCRASPDHVVFVIDAHIHLRAPSRRARAAIAYVQPAPVLPRTLVRRVVPAGAARVPPTRVYVSICTA